MVTTTTPRAAGALLVVASLAPPAPGRYADSATIASVACHQVGRVALRRAGASGLVAAGRRAASAARPGSAAPPRAREPSRRKLVILHSGTLLDIVKGGNHPFEGHHPIALLQKPSDESPIQ